jgi:hypothetical protein
MSAESKYSKKTFSISNIRYLSTSIFYQNFDFCTIFRGKKGNFCSKYVFLALVSAENSGSFELRFVSDPF